MRKAGGIISLIAGVFAVIAAGFTLMVGGIGGAVDADESGLIIMLGFGGVLSAFLVIIFGALALNSRSKTHGILLLLTSVFGFIFGGGFVAFFMVLSFIGSILVIIDSDKKAPITSKKTIEKTANLFDQEHLEKYKENAIKIGGKAYSFSSKLVIGVYNFISSKMSQQNRDALKKHLFLLSLSEKTKTAVLSRIGEEESVDSFVFRLMQEHNAIKKKFIEEQNNTKKYKAYAFKVNKQLEGIKKRGDSI